MSFINQYIDLISNVIPIDFLEDIIPKVDENTLLEILTYEISLGISKDNVDDSIIVLSKIIEYDDYKKYILINCIKKTIYNPTKSYQKVVDYFNLSYSKDLTTDSFIQYNANTLSNIEYIAKSYNISIDEYINIFYNDDLDAYIKLIENIDIEQYLDNYSFYDARFAIKNDAEDIFINIIKNNSFSDTYLYTFLVVAIRVGNMNIIRMLLHNGASMNDISDSSLIDCHHFDVISYFLKNRTIDFNNIRYTSSLYYHFMNDIRFCCCGISHDLSCTQKYKEFEVIIHNCINSAYTRNDYRFSISCLERTCMNKNKEMFIVILNKLLKDNFYSKETLIEVMSNYKDFIGSVFNVDFQG